jgi:hypothetical protein
VHTATSTPGIAVRDEVPTTMVSVTVADLGFDQRRLPTQDQLLSSVPQAMEQDPTPARNSCATGVARASPGWSAWQANWQSVAGPHAPKHRQKASQSGADAQDRTPAQVPGLACRQSWQDAALFGGPPSGVIAPHARPHSFSHVDAMHALSAETLLAVPTGSLAAHWARHIGSPLQLPRQVSYDEHTASAAHADDAVQQLVETQDAHSFVP